MKLFIPGPVDVRKDLLKYMSKPLIGHRTREISDIQKRIQKNLRKIMKTNNPVVLLTGSGTSAMESSLCSLVKKKVAVFSIGAFGNRFYDIAKAHSLDVDKVFFGFGNHIEPKIFKEKLQSGLYDVITVTHNETSTGIMNDLKTLSKIWKQYPDVLVIVDSISSFGGFDLPVDDLGIDVLLTATQKSLGLPPGIAIMSLSEKVLKRLEEVEERSYYLSLKRIYKKHKENYQYPTTPNISLMMALDYQLDYIVNKEGIDNRFKRHKILANYTREWAKKHFKLFAEEKYASQTVTTIVNTKNLDLEKLSDNLKKKGYLFAHGYGPMKNKTFRIGHMADRTLKDLKKYIKEIEKSW